MANAQIKYGVDIEAIATTKGVVPFWLRSNQFGSIPMAGASSSIVGVARKDYERFRSDSSSVQNIWDWGMSIEGRVNTNLTRSDFFFTEGFLKARLGPLELKGGRTKETIGFTGDTTLTSGSFAVAGNALGVPKIEIAIPDYYILPLFGGRIAVKGNFAHGWIGKAPLHSSFAETTTLVDEVTTYFHEKSFYGRFGKHGSRMNLYAGFNHQVMWGNEREYYGEKYDMSNLETYFYVVSGKAFGRNVEKSKVGNHLGTIDIAGSYRSRNLSFTVYKQHFYDVGALYHLANLLDGLHGMAIKNLKPNRSALAWKTILFEFLYTKNQAGEYWSRRTPSGDEDYYNSYIYSNGWSYRKTGLGTPFITSRQLVRPKTLSAPYEYFVNNRVIALHTGASFSNETWHLIAKASFSRNYGTYGTTIGHSRDYNRWEPTKDYFHPKNQFSGFIGATKVIKKGIRVGFATGFDYGTLLSNSAGGQLKITYQL